MLGGFCFSPKVARLSNYELGGDCGHSPWPSATWWKLSHKREGGLPTEMGMRAGPCWQIWGSAASLSNGRGEILRKRFIPKHPEPALTLPPKVGGWYAHSEKELGHWHRDAHQPGQVRGARSEVKPAGLPDAGFLPGLEPSGLATMWSLTNI